MSDLNIEASVVKVDAGDLPQSANLFLEKVSQAVGGYLAPWQTVRTAKAEAAAALIRAKSEVQVTDLQRRAAARMLEEETQRQAVIEHITSQAIPLLNATSDPSQMDNDWTRNFFEKVRIVSNEEMQTLWSKILAGEANVPGAFSKPTINLLSNLDQSDAMLFATLCNFTWENWPVVLDPKHEIYTKHGINIDSLRDLESLGLISFKEAMALTLSLEGVLMIVYQGRTLPIGNRNTRWTVPMGVVTLTRAGRQLKQVCQLSPIEGFWEYVCDAWKHVIFTEPEPGPPASAPVDPDVVTRIQA